MKTFVLAGAALAALAAAAPAAAHPHHGGHAERQPLSRAAVQSFVESEFARLDGNRDGFVTLEEAREQRQELRSGRRGQRGERRAAAFERLDANDDGVLSREEFESPRVGARAEHRGERRAHRMERRGGGFGGFARLGEQRFERLDANDDGRLSLAEANQGALQRFDRIDANRDGTISTDERAAAREARAQRQHRRRG